MMGAATEKDLLTRRIYCLPRLRRLAARTAFETRRPHRRDVVRASDAQILEIRQCLHGEVGHVVTLLRDDDVADTRGPAVLRASS